MRHPFRSSLCMLALLSSACGSTAGNDGNTGSGTDALNAAPATGEAVAGGANSKPEPNEGCGGTGEEASESPIEDCYGEVFAYCESTELDEIDCKELAIERCEGWAEPPAPPTDCYGEVFEACADRGIDEIDCKQLAVEKCEGWGEPPAPPTDCYGEVFEACADRGIDEVDCKDLAIAHCEPEPSTEPYDPSSDCYGEVQRFCDEGRLDPAECKDIAWQRCEPEPVEPDTGTDPYTDCLKTGRDPVACKEALADGSGRF